MRVRSTEAAVPSTVTGAVYTQRANSPLATRDNSVTGYVSDNLARRGAQLQSQKVCRQHQIRLDRKLVLRWIKGRWLERVVDTGRGVTAH